MFNQSDATLKASVLAELAWEPSVTTAHIGVTARDGVVTLSGHVKSWSERDLAGSTAWAAPGATDVENQLAIA